MRTNMTKKWIWWTSEIDYCYKKLENEEVDKFLSRTHVENFFKKKISRVEWKMRNDDDECAGWEHKKIKIKEWKSFMNNNKRIKRRRWEYQKYEEDKEKFFEWVEEEQQEDHRK